MKITRRHMLSQTSQAIIAAGITAGVAPLFAAPERRTYKIGACEWSLRRENPSSLAVAKELGLDGVQINMGRAQNNMWLRQREVQQDYLAAAREHGVEIAGLALGEMNNVPLKSDPRAAVWLLDAMKVAEGLGVKQVMIAQFHKGDLKNDKEGIDRTVELLKEVAPRYEKAGLILSIENYLSAEENMDILQRVACPALKVYYDVGNSTDKGYDIYREIRLLKNNICEFHAKDGKHMLGAGRIDFRKVREAMEEIGYTGWIQIEAAAPHDFLTDYKAHLAYLRKVFA